MSKEEARKVLEEFMEIEKKMELAKDKKSFEVLKKTAKNLVKKHKGGLIKKPKLAKRGY